MKCICMDCGIIFYEGKDEQNLLFNLSFECPSWLKKALCHMAKEEHQVVIYMDFTTNIPWLQLVFAPFGIKAPDMKTQFPLSLNRLVQQMGLTRERILLECHSQR